MERRRLIIISEDVLRDKSLSLAEKCVYARIAGFEEYYESADECADLLGLGLSTVRSAKQKLEKLGYITCLRDTGRGKAYRAVLDRQSNSALSEECKMPSSEECKMPSSLYKHKRENIKEDVLTNVSTGDNVARTPEIRENPAKSSESKASTGTTYGNSAINSMFDYWQEKTGQAIISREKANRRACYNLLRNKHIGEEKLRHAIEFVGETAEDRFAPRVSDFVDLQTKFNALCDYKRRQGAQSDTSDGKTQNGAVSSGMKANYSSGGVVPFEAWRPSEGDLAREQEWNERQRRQTEESAKVDSEWLNNLKQETLRKIHEHGRSN